MTKARKTQSMDESVFLEAIEWLEIHRSGDTTSSNRAQFLLWLRKSPVNVEHYIHAATTARMFQMVLAQRTDSSEELIRKAREDDSAILVLDLPQQSRSAVSPLVDKQPATRRWGRILSFAAAVLLSALLFVRELGSDGRIGFPVTFKTQHSEQGSWRLPDGSMLHLNSGSEAIVWYTRGERVVDLVRGQAMFQVAHEKHRRFRVEAGAAQIVSVGTQFDVMRRSAETRVAVREGKVKVFPASVRLGDDPAIALPGTPLEAGKAIVLDSRGVLRDSPETVLQATAWLHREIVFQHSPLRSVVNDFNQYSTIPIVIESVELERMTISGVFGAYDLESFLHFLSRLDGVAVEVQQDRIRVYVIQKSSEKTLTVEADGKEPSVATRD